MIAMDSMFLTAEEIQTLTGLKGTSRQVGWLRIKGWRFELNATGRPVIARRYAEKMLGCCPEHETVHRPNFGALRAA